MVLWPKTCTIQEGDRAGEALALQQGIGKGGDVNVGFDNSGGYHGESRGGYNNNVYTGGGDNFDGDNRGNKMVEVKVVMVFMIEQLPSNVAFLSYRGPEK